ncbi:macro domain-containing protein [Lentzea sp. NPDC006480]|uniref:type II toxin-antitoxin system antitoxin DNA ADP-ribosyl glycohydrolase DarG n=1 Tax=Lentzea sp. NPDC006480 TaxID=3157176 RepID=UPI0033A7C32E
MFHQAQGNLLESTAEALVNTVNTVGVMGKGIALQFKRAYPESFREYASACRKGEFEVGKILVHETGLMTNPKYILAFPTKRHWRAQSRLEDVRSGLSALREVIEKHNIRSIAIPPLGCGNGGLDWNDVYPLIEAALGDLTDVDVFVYAPSGAPSTASMPVRTKRPRLTRFGGAVIRAFDEYIDLSLNAGLAVERKLSMLEAHKIAYFLQESGWPLGLRFTQGHYGPYAKNLDNFISAVEGHFIYGFGDGTGGAKATLSLDGSAIDEARRLLADDDGFSRAIERLGQIVAGFEFPYGVELLSTVHFAATDAENSDHNISMIIKRIENWSPRKRALFKQEQASVAYNHLVGCSLLDP